MISLSHIRQEMLSSLYHAKVTAYHSYLVKRKDLFGIVRTVYPLVVYMQSNKIHKMF